MSSSGFVEVEGARLYYEEEGSGPALLLLHAGIANLRMWDPQVSAFAERYRVIRYDTRGFGETTTADVAYSNRQDMADVLDHLDVESAFLVGCSRGGQIALDFTLERPERVAALVTVGSGPGGFQPQSTPKLDALWGTMEALEETGNWTPLAELETALWVDGYGQPADRLDADLRQQVHDWILDSYQRHGHEPAQPQPLEPPAVERLGEIRVPVLVTWGISTTRLPTRPRQRWPMAWRERDGMSSPGRPTCRISSSPRSSPRSSSSSWPACSGEMDPNPFPAPNDVRGQPNRARGGR